jgi:hypothetical protein
MRRSMQVSSWPKRAEALFRRIVWRLGLKQRAGTSASTATTGTTEEIAGGTAVVTETEAIISTLIMLSEGITPRLTSILIRLGTEWITSPRASTLPIISTKATSSLETLSRFTRGFRGMRELKER